MNFLGFSVVWAVLTKVKKLKIVIGLDKDLSFTEKNNLMRHFNPIYIQWKRKNKNNRNIGAISFIR